MMSNNRFRTCLVAVCFSLALATGARAQLEEDTYFPGSGDVQPFAPADLSTYGSGPRQNEGWFLNFDQLYWTITAPDRTTVGRENFHPATSDGSSFGFQSNSLDTGFIDAQFEDGNRVEFGLVRNDRGWLVSAFQLQNQNHSVEVSDAGVSFLPVLDPTGVFSLEGFADIDGDGFDDDINLNTVFGRDGIDLGTPDGMGGFMPPLDGIPDVPFATDFGDLVYFPVFFDTLQARNRTEMQGVELMHIWRKHHLGPRGGSWEFFAGFRYLRFNEEFNVHALGGIIGESFWNTESDNDIIGGQIGVRWNKRVHRFGMSFEGRVFAGANFQSTNQIGELAVGTMPGVANFPLDLRPESFHNVLHDTEFAPLAELRVQFHYQVTQAIFLRAGWTGMWMDGIARPSNMILYRIPGMGLLAGESVQDVVVNGLTFGIEINR